MPAEDDIQFPKVFGRYLLLRRLARGGMGEIFLAKLGEIQGFEKPIVIKKILPSLAQDEEFLRRFIEEAKIAIKLSHGNIVTVYEVGVVEDQYFLAMQHVQGRDLRSLMTRARERGVKIPLDLCLLIVREITNGLSYAHRATDEAGRTLDVVHCDISPPNVLISVQGEVKLIDFGIAKSALHRQAESEEMGFGKFGYMAPEQLLRGYTVDRRTDIYSTGVIGYELLTGERLFQFPRGTDSRTVIREVTAARYGPPSERNRDLGTKFDSLVMRALSVNPEGRYQRVEELRDGVQQHLYGMNPSISSDDLGVFVRDLFGDEVRTEMNLLRSVSETDVDVYRSELDGATSQTVSIAMGDIYTMHSVSRQIPSPPAHDSLVIAPRKSVSASGSLPVRQESTRPLTAGERKDAIATAVSAAETQPSGGDTDVALRFSTFGRRLFGGRKKAFGLAFIVGTASALAVAWGTYRLYQAQLGGGQAGSESGRAGSSNGRGAIGDNGMQFHPMPIRRSRPKRRKRGRRTRARRSSTGRTLRSGATNVPKSDSQVTAALVRKRFRTLRKNYQRFRASYGDRLADDWQKILFTNTYGNLPEKYEKLDHMISDLQKKMDRVRFGDAEQK